MQQHHLQEKIFHIILKCNDKEVYHALSSDDTVVRASKVFNGKAFCKGVAEYAGKKVTACATLPAASDRLKRDAIRQVFKKPVSFYNRAFNSSSWFNITNFAILTCEELIENSCDAGASKIIVEVNEGGLNKIKIIDNGKGIDKDDLPLALERFATSKAATVEDVYSAHFKIISISGLIREKCLISFIISPSRLLELFKNLRLAGRFSKSLSASAFCYK